MGKMGKRNRKNHMTKLSKKKAVALLHAMWEGGQLPSNFTEDHSDHHAAVQFAMKYGYFDLSDFYGD
jgi:hypothetical protein